VAAIRGAKPSRTVAAKLVVQAYAQSLWQLGDLKHCNRTSKMVASFADGDDQQLLGVLQLPNVLKGGAPLLKEAAAKPPSSP
jgi:hypothetical protein